MTPGKGMNMGGMATLKEELERQAAGIEGDPEEAIQKALESVSQGASEEQPPAADSSKPIKATPEATQQDAAVDEERQPRSRRSTQRREELPVVVATPELPEDKRVSVTIWISPESKAMARSAVKHYRDEDDNTLSLGEFFEMAIQDATRKLEKKCGRKFPTYNGPLKKGPPIR